MSFNYSIVHGWLYQNRFSLHVAIAFFSEKNALLVSPTSKMQVSQTNPPNPTPINQPINPQESCIKPPPALPRWRSSLHALLRLKPLRQVAKSGKRNNKVLLLVGVGWFPVPSQCVLQISGLLKTSSFIPETIYKCLWRPALASVSFVGDAYQRRPKETKGEVLQLFRTAPALLPQSPSSSLWSLGHLQRIVGERISL